MSEHSQHITGFAPVNGAEIYYEVAGAGHPLVLIHSGLADSRMWDEQLDAFARHYRVIRYDLRGVGRSDLPPGPFSSRADLRELLRFLRVERAHLVGLSLGAQIALDFALEYPEMVSALVLAAPGLSGYEPSDELKQQFAEIDAAIEAGDLVRANELELRLWVDGPKRTTEQVDPAVRERVREMNAPGLEQDWGRVQPRRLSPPAIERLDEVRVPTLLVVGEQDASDTYAIVDRLRTGIVGATMPVVVPAAAHMVNMERPETFNRIVLGFLAGLPGFRSQTAMSASEEAEWYEQIRSLLENAYLAASDPRAQSGMRGDAAKWERQRRVIAEAIHRDGTFLDVGCANGLLMETMVEWTRARGYRIEPYGLDISERLAELARSRLPPWADHIFAGNVMTWQPPHRFDFVRTELVYVPDHRRRALVRRLLDRFVAPGGRLVVCGYGSSSRRQDAEPVGALLRGWGLPVAGEAEVTDSNGVVVTRVTWVQVPS